ncbi:MAG: hypothetical protein DBY09_01190 [Selenomonadales bacterium]|nr:MAG: hypothetical protein DBY09_01190 [Selenomonadales bacterium]
MSNQDSRIRNRQLRAYGVFAIAAILLVIIIIAIIGLFSGDAPADIQNSATPTPPAITATPTPENTPTSEPTPSEEATPTPSIIEKVVKTSQNGSVNLRAQASSDSQRVTTLKTGQILTVLSEENGWAKVRTQDNQEGYVSAEYLIDKVTGTVVNINSALNVRETASSTADKVGTLENGDTVTVLDTSNSDWTLVALSDGKIGYCSAQYIQIS